MRGKSLITTVAASLALLAFAAAPALGAGGPKFAPLHRPGPKLSKHVSPKLLKASVTCSPGIRNAKKEPVLLFPATGVDSQHNFSWNYEPMYDDLGIPWCASDQPGDLSTNQGDVIIRSYYVAYAIRHVHKLAGRKIAVQGHSQGGMIMRTGLRWWPDTRKMVADVIGMAGTNHGTDQAATSCQSGCTPAAGQQASNSNFTRALNSGAQTFKGISYTEIYTSLDEVVTPQPAASSVAGPGKITNVGIQDICPADTSEHLKIGTQDPVASALALDALKHSGPAKVSRIDPSDCTEPFMPGVNPATVATDTANSLAQLVASQAYGNAPEPKLRCWMLLHPKACRKHRAAATG